MLFPKFTLTTDEALKDLPKERERLLRDNLEACADPTIHRQLVNLVLHQMKSIVQDNYHPACRYNAMLVISGLNSVEAEAHRRRQEDAGTADRRLAVYSRTVHAGRKRRDSGRRPAGFGSALGVG